MNHTLRTRCHEYWQVTQGGHKKEDIPSSRRSLSIALVLIQTIVMSVGRPPTVHAAASGCFPGNVYGAIGAKHQALGGDTGKMGCATSDEFDVPGGRARNFRDGSISWKFGAPAAYAVRGDIFRVWTSYGREKWSFPVSDELPTSDGTGRYSQFEGATMVRANGTVQAYYPAYTFSIDKYEIGQIASFSSDTNYVYVAVKQGDRVLDSKQQYKGDQGNGTYKSGLSEGITLTDVLTPFAFAYAITNNGHGKSEDLHKGLDAAFAGAAVVAGAVGSPVASVAVGLLALAWDKYVGSHTFFANCDGIVADAQISGDYRMLADWTAGQQPHSERTYSRKYHGDGGTWCSPYSHYYVSWTVTRWAP